VVGVKVEVLFHYLVKHYFSNRSGRNYGLLLLGPPGVGKSTVVYDAAEYIASKVGKQFIKFVIRWDPGKKKFVVNGDSVEDVLAEPSKYFVLTDFRLSTVEPSDLTGIPRSHDGITFYEPLVWAVLHSSAPGIIFLDERTVFGYGPVS
jgi:DNA polymerase III delta prime subunit